MMQGVDNYDGELILLTNIPKTGLALAAGRKNIHVVSWLSLNGQLQGSQLPIAIDNSAMMVILTEALQLSDEERRVAADALDREAAAKRITQLTKQNLSAVRNDLEALKGRWYVRLGLWLEGLISEH